MNGRVKIKMGKVYLNILNENELLSEELDECMSLAELVNYTQSLVLEGCTVTVCFSGWSGEVECSPELNVKWKAFK